MKQWGMMNGRGKLMKLRDKPASLPLQEHKTSFEWFSNTQDIHHQ
jgi:hypothetical protein